MTDYLFEYPEAWTLATWAEVICLVLLAIVLARYVLVGVQRFGWLLSPRSERQVEARAVLRPPPVIVPIDSAGRMIRVPCSCDLLMHTIEAIDTGSRKLPCGETVTFHQPRGAR